MRPRVLIGLAALAGLGIFGFAVGAQTGSETVATHTQTFEHVVTYTIPTETTTTTETTVQTETLPPETVTTTQTETVVSTVTVTAPTTTEPPPTTTEPDPPDPPTGTRIICNGQGPNTSPANSCREWVCSQNVMNYATAGLPLIIETHTDPADPGLNGDVRFNAGCSGHPSVDPDVILEIHNGPGEGSPEDMVNFANSSTAPPQNLQISGFGGCAPVGGSAHQDGFQIQSATNVLVHDFELGDWETQTPGCHGAGGLWYVSGNVSAARLTNVRCVRCRMVGSSPSGGLVGTGFYLGLSTDSGAIGSCFSANSPFTQDGQAVRGVNIDNVFVDRNGPPQDSPEECQL